MSNIALEVKNLNQVISGQNILHDINFQLQKGRSLVILGGSGAGKSVLLQTITGLITKTTGDIFIYDKKYNPSKDIKNVFEHVGIMFQSCGLFNFLNVIENVACLESLLFFKNTKEQFYKKAQEVLLKVGLDEKAFLKPITQISGGMKKRVAFARMLFYNPSIFFLDEPTAGLDPISSDEIAKLLRGLIKQENKACITITHDIHVATEIADDILFLYKGRMLFYGNKEDFTLSENQTIKRYIEACRVN